MATLVEHEQHGLSEESCAFVVSADEIVALEDRIQRTVELVRNLDQALTAAEERAADREGRVASAEERAAQAESHATQAEEWAANAEAHVREYGPIMEQMQNELNALRGERKNARQRVERMLAQLDALELLGDRSLKNRATALVAA